MSISCGPGCRWRRWSGSMRRRLREPCDPQRRRGQGSAPCANAEARYDASQAARYCMRARAERLHGAAAGNSTAGGSEPARRVARIAGGNRGQTRARLVERALANNIDLNVALTRVREADARVRLARSAQKPSVDLDFLGFGRDRTYSTVTGNGLNFSAYKLDA